MAEHQRIAVISAYEPNGQLLKLAEEAYAQGFRLLVVDDGSGEAYKEIFSQLEGYADLISYEENCGKGRDIPILEMEIETIYIDNNASSHFKPVRNSFRIYGQILKAIGTFKNRKVH